MFDTDSSIAVDDTQHQGLVLLSQARFALSQARTIEDFKEICDQGQAILKYWKRRRDVSVGARNDAAEIVIEAEVELARVLESITRRGAGRPKKELAHDEPISFADACAKVNLSTAHGKRLVTVLSLPDEDRLKLISDTKSEGKELTSTLVLKAAKKHRNAERNRTITINRDSCTVDDLSTLAGIKTIYADPPWQYDNQGTRAATNNHYPTMDIDAICNLPIQNIVDKQALLFLWTTNGFLVDALTRVIPAWGFEFKSSIIWCKPQIGIGNYVRNAHEFLLIASRGGAVTLEPQRNVQESWVSVERGEHSSKPHVFRDIVEKLSPQPWLEVFGREARPGWAVWGNEVSRQQFMGFGNGV